jgi:hypothetical protein
MALGLATWLWSHVLLLWTVCCRELYTEKEVIVEERRARWENNPMGRFTYDYLLQALDNPYRRPVIGETACHPALACCAVTDSCVCRLFAGGGSNACSARVLPEDSMQRQL